MGWKGGGGGKGELDRDGFEAEVYVKDLLRRMNLEGILKVEARLVDGTFLFSLLHLSSFSLCSFSSRYFPEDDILSWIIAVAAAAASPFPALCFPPFHCASFSISFNHVSRTLSFYGIRGDLPGNLFNRAPLF